MSFDTFDDKLTNIKNHIVLIMKHFTNQSYESHVGRMNYGWAKFRRIALFPLMLLMLLLLPTNMVAQTTNDEPVTFTALEGNPEGVSEAENFKKLFDGKKTINDFSKWCCKFSGSAYVIFEASKAGVPVGYTITTGDDNANWGCSGRNPLSWKLYGNNEGENGAWTLIQAVENDTKLQDKNCTSYDFTCEGSTSYKYFKWEITAIHSGSILQVGEFELKLNTCSHKKTDGSSALGAVINTIGPTCAEHGYTTHECSLCHSTVKVYKDDELKAHTLTHHEATSDIKEHWQCDVCRKYFSDSNATQEVTYGSLLFDQAYAMFDDATETLTFSYGTKPEGAYALNQERAEPEWRMQKIRTVVFDASFASARPTNCYGWFKDFTNLTTIEGFEYLNTENVTNMTGVFNGCSALTLLDLTNFNTAKVSDMSYMFMGCSALTTIFVSDKFVTNQVTSSDNMFHMCINLIGAIEYDGSKSDHTYANYENGYFSPEGGFNAYAEFDNATGTLTFRRGLSKPAGVYDLNEGRNLPDWNNLGTNVKKVVFDASFASARPTNCYGWFKDFTNLTTIEGFEYLNTENVTNMTGVFNGCSALTSLDLTNFNTAKVTDMKLLFANCSALESLDLSMFNTENVTSMPSMFNGATNLKTLNVSNFNTEKVNNMGHMFANCPNLTSLDLSSFNTKGVEYVDNIFKNCSNLTTIYASENFAFGSGLKNGADMFLGCDKLKGFIEYNKNTDTDKNNSEFANYKTGYFTKLVGKNGEEKIGAVGETLTAESLALDDDKDFVAYEPFAAKAASYNRTMKEGTTWATLCLPFEVSLDNQKFRAFKLLSADDVTETVELEEVKTIEAGTPVIIKMINGATELEFSEANKAIAKDVQTSKTANGNYQLQGLYTQMEFSKDVDNNCYIVKGNKLMNPAKLLENTNVKKVVSKPFRAYMVDKSSSAAGAKMFSIGFDDDSTTAIDSLNTIANDKAEYFDLQGKRLNEPQKGINIVKRGGKTMKVIIK